MLPDPAKPLRNSRLRLVYVKSQSMPNVLLNPISFSSLPLWEILVELSPCLPFDPRPLETINSNAEEEMSMSNTRLKPICVSIEKSEQKTDYRPSCPLQEGRCRKGWYLRKYR